MTVPSTNSVPYVQFCVCLFFSVQQIWEAVVSFY